MDILAGLMENLLEPWCHNGYKDVIYGVSNHNTFDTKAYWWLIYFNCLNDVLWLLVLCYLCLPRSAFVWPAMCNCGISWSISLTFVAFGQALHRKPGAAVQCRKSRYWNKVSPWNWWCDCKIRFWQICQKNGNVCFPDNIDIEWLVHFSCDNIALLKATLGSTAQFCKTVWQKALYNRTTYLQSLTKC